MSAPLRTPDFHRAAGAFLADGQRVSWHDQALWHLRAKRDRAAAASPDWEALRDHAAALKAHALDHLPELWGRFAANARAAGWTVHFAADAAELRATVHGLLAAAGVRRVVKSKSMLSEECGLNHHLEEHGFEVVDTDLGERIVQLRREPPSHIVVPAIHLKRAEVGELFHRELGTPAGLDDPTALAHAARADLRRRFLAAEAGITGVNIAVAETGGMLVCTNEGNADLGTALPPLHIAVVGAEKVVPSLEDAGVLLRLLARSATGQPITSYSTHLAGPDPRRPGHACHIVVVDNGRSRLLADDEHRRALSCIRCGACLNTCPVYRRASGHAYGTVIPGPIGAVLAPAMIGSAPARALPFASSLCGSCSAVCPVRVDLHHQLLAWRRTLARAGLVPLSKRLAMRAGAWFLAHPRLFAAGGWLGRRLAFLARLPLPGPHRLWLRHRGLPDLPADSFRAQWRRRHG